MTISECVNISLSVAMIVFPSFVIMPTAIGLVHKSPRKRDTYVYVFPLILSGAILLVSTIYSGIGLAQIGGTGEVLLIVAISIFTITVLVFLDLLGSYVYEMAVLATYQDAAKAAED